MAVCYLVVAIHTRNMWGLSGFQASLGMGNLSRADGITCPSWGVLYAFIVNYI